jgi:hypothetical protein
VSVTGTVSAAGTLSGKEFSGDDVGGSLEQPAASATANSRNRGLGIP